MNCSSLCSRAGCATIVLAMNAADKIRRAPDHMNGSGRAATTHSERAPKKVIQQRVVASRTPGERANPPREKINRSHRAAQNSSSIGKVFRRGFAAGMAFGEAIGVEARREAGTPLLYSPPCQKTGAKQKGSRSRRGERGRSRKGRARVAASGGEAEGSRVAASGIYQQRRVGAGQRLPRCIAAIASAISASAFFTEGRV